MLGRIWRIVLLLIALVLTIWPDLFTGAGWVVLIALLVLLISELFWRQCCCGGCYCGECEVKRPSEKMAANTTKAKPKARRK